MAGNDFTQTTAGSRPFIAAADLNSLDTVDFQGAEYLLGPNQNSLFTVDVDEDFYLAIVLAIDTYVESDLIFHIPRRTDHNAFFNFRMASSNRLAFNYRNQSAGATIVNFSSSPTAGGGYSLVEFIKDGANITAYLDGTQVASASNARVLVFSSAENDQAENISIGARDDGDFFADVQIAEVVLAKTIPSAAERALYHTWVEDTYGLTIA